VEKEEEKEELEKELKKKKLNWKNRSIWRSLPNFKSICPQMAEKNALKVIWGQTDQPTNQPRTNIVSYRGACMRLKMQILFFDYTITIIFGKFHDQGEAEWKVIRGQLRGHKDTPCRRPTPGRPISRPGVGCPQYLFGGFGYYWLVIIFFNIVLLIMDIISCHFGGHSTPDKESGGVRTQIG
jgi:hypothetical protein